VCNRARTASIPSRVEAVPLSVLVAVLLIVLLGMAKPGTAAVVRSPADSKRAGANQARLTERTVRIAREVDRVADELDVTSAQVAVAWVRQHQRECGRHLVPVVGARTTEQLRDLLGSLHVELPAGQAVRLEEVSRIELGFAL
jgi:aryl-alcohol dehydrogenase-like predicted oxidoreductase